MKGTMPATVNSSDGSGEISEALGTTVCPRWAKCSRKRRRISAVCIFRIYSVLRGRTTGRSAGGGYLGEECRPGSGVGRVRTVAAAGQLHLVAGREGGVETGARAEFALPLGGRSADVGAELADRVCEVAQALGDGPGDPGGGQLVGSGAQL